MGLDIRFPIGLMFVVVGAMLAAWGALAGDNPGARPLGVNINLWWGLVLVVFGAVMLWVSLRARRRVQPPSAH